MIYSQQYSNLSASLGRAETPMSVSHDSFDRNISPVSSVSVFTGTNTTCISCLSMLYDIKIAIPLKIFLFWLYDYIQQSREPC